MKISLKKARKLEASIKSLVSKEIDTTVKVRILSSWGDIQESIETTNADIVEKISNYKTLVAIQYEIRRKIEVANETASLNESMNRKAQLSAEVQVLQKIADSEVQSIQEKKDSIDYQKTSMHKERAQYGSDGAMDLNQVL